MRLLRSGHPGPVNIGNPYEVSMLELARIVARLVGVDPESIEFIPRPQDDPEMRQPDIRLARAVLGWEPRVGHEDGLRATIDWFRAERERMAREEGVIDLIASGDGKVAGDWSDVLGPVRDL